MKGTKGLLHRRALWACFPLLCTVFFLLEAGWYLHIYLPFGLAFSCKCLRLLCSTRVCQLCEWFGSVVGRVCMAYVMLSGSQSYVLMSGHPSRSSSA